MKSALTSWDHSFGKFDRGDEEFANMVTHAIGVVLSVIALIALTIVGVLYGTPEGLMGGVVFGISLILAYTASTLLHLPWIKPVKLMFLAVDQSMIFALIAGTYTPILLLSLEPSKSLLLLGLIWALAIIGIILRLTYFDPNSLVLTGLYLAIGWLGIFWVYSVVAALGWWTVALLFAGGLMYSGGVVFYLWRSLRYNHAIWHLFVLAGSALHFWAIFTVIGRW
jgi:hemolysin III